MLCLATVLIWDSVSHEVFGFHHLLHTLRILRVPDMLLILPFGLRSGAVRWGEVWCPVFGVTWWEIFVEGKIQSWIGIDLRR